VNPKKREAGREQSVGVQERHHKNIGYKSYNNAVLRCVVPVLVLVGDLNLALYSALPSATSVQKKAVHKKQCHLMTVVPNSPCHGIDQTCITFF
jgi:hypothetical protein